jgi:2-amino-4-hydroxy-6-hydroxymethyldihydropteridine diphosphokinase
MHKVFLGIGGNLGKKPENFKKVHRFIQNNLGEIINKSSVYETPPWGFEAKESFWNQVIEIDTNYSPSELLGRIHEIEKQFGRIRNKEEYSSREMDIDILYYDEIYMETEKLIIPHPHMHQRKFVLVPLAEIDPEIKHPLLRLTSIQMLENCHDESVIKKVKTE